MKLTRQQKVGLVLAVFGVGAVLIDQVFVLGPTQASANSAGPAAGSATSGSETAPPARSGPAARMPLTLAATNQPGGIARQLDDVRTQLALTADDADAGFAVAPLIAGLGTPAVEPVEASATEADEPAPSDFPVIRVTSMLEGDRPVAFVDGRPYRVGDGVQGATLKAIARGRVVFEYEGRLFAVEVERPGRP